MVSDASVNNGSSPTEAPDGQPAASTPAEPAAPPPAEPAAPESQAPAGAASTPAPPKPRSLPKSPVTRDHVDALGRGAGKAVTGVAKALAALARVAARIVTQTGRGIDHVPPALRLLLAAGILMLLGVVGTIALPGTAGLLCAIVVVPLCSITVGALGHRWFSTSRAEPSPRTDAPGREVATADLSRSVAYVDKKLTVALNAFGSDRHQQAVIALFQAKTAVELALGTEQDADSRTDAPLPIADHPRRPRIQAGNASLAAS